MHLMEEIEKFSNLLKVGKTQELGAGEHSPSVVGSVVHLLLPEAVSSWRAKYWSECLGVSKALGQSPPSPQTSWPLAPVLVCSVGTNSLSSGQSNLSPSESQPEAKRERFEQKNQTRGMGRTLPRIRMTYMPIKRFPLCTRQDAWSCWLVACVSARSPARLVGWLTGWLAGILPSHKSGYCKRLVSSLLPPAAPTTLCADANFWLLCIIATVLVSGQKKLFHDEAEFPPPHRTSHSESSE